MKVKFDSSRRGNKGLKYFRDANKSTHRIVGGGEGGLLFDPGYELQFGGRDETRENIIYIHKKTKLANTLTRSHCNFSPNHMHDVMTLVTYGKCFFGVSVLTRESQY